MAVFVQNLDKLLSFVARPTNICLIIIIGCVVFLINSKWILGALSMDFHSADDLTEWVDEATAAAITTLRLSLAVSALQLVRFLCFRYLEKAVRHLLRVVPINRLLLTVILLVLICVFVLAPGYEAMAFVPRSLGIHVHSRYPHINFPAGNHAYFEKQYVCSLHVQHLNHSYLGDCDLMKRRSLYHNPLVFLHVNKVGILEPILNSQLPSHSQYKRYRYPTEDVQLPCELMVQLTHHRSDQVYVVIWWTKDNVRLDTTGHRVTVRSSRRLVSRAAPQNEAVGTQWVLVSETLLIRRLHVEDFGEYECRAFVTLDAPSRLIPSQLEDLFSQYSCPVSTYFLHTHLESNQLVSIPPSNAVIVQVSYRMSNDSEDDVFIEHKVNGVLREDLPEEDKCSSELLWAFLGHIPQRSKQFRRSLRADHEGNTILNQAHEFCVEQYHYGLHTFTLRRQFFNVDTGTEDYLELLLGSVLVVPELSELSSDLKSKSYFGYLKMTDCWEFNRTVVSEYCSNKLKQMKALSRFHFMVDSWGPMMIFISSHLFYIWWAYSLIRYVLSLTLPDVFNESVVEMVSPDLLTVLHPPLPLQKCGHVFLAYAERDVKVSDDIQSILQSYDLAVYDCHRDVAPGQPPLIAWDHAMEDSSSFVVVVSVDYLSEPELILQFQSIHNIMLEHQVRENHVLLVVAGRCHIPPALGPLPIIDLQQKHWEQQLEWWAFCLKGEFPHKTVVKQIGRDLLRDTHKLLTQGRPDDDGKQVLPPLSFLIRKLEAICMPVTGLQAFNYDDKEDDFPRDKEDGFPREVKDRSQSGVIIQTSSQCLREAVESDFRDENAISYAVESTQCSLTQKHLSTEIQYEESVKLPHLGDEIYVSADSGREGASVSHEVFLTYCEESAWDRCVAAELKAALEGRSSKYKLFPEGQCLHVYDAVQDLMPGQAEVHIVSSAAKSSAFVVLLSPAYCHDPLTRRLHFPQVLQAVYSDAVETECVLIVHTSGILQHPQSETPVSQAQDDDDDGDDDGFDGDGGVAETEVSHSVTDSSIPKALWEGKREEADIDRQGGLKLPKWFQAFTQLHWSPCVGLCEKERFRWWARRVHCLVTDTQFSDSHGHRHTAL